MLGIPNSQLGTLRIYAKKKYKTKFEKRQLVLGWLLLHNGRSRSTANRLAMALADRNPEEYEYQLKNAIEHFKNN